MTFIPLKTVFGCDLRTLALFRVSLATLLLLDLFNRSRFLSAHYTDFGILPRTDLIAIMSQWRFSLHLLSGEAFYQWILFAVAVVFGLALLLGYRTRLANIVSLILYLSLIHRNPVVLQGGDTLTTVLLFWGMFLPLGARFSVDAALNSKPVKENAYFSVATIGLLLQAMSVYFFTALLKSGNEWIPDGTAVYYALSLDTFATPVARFLLQFFPLTQFLTYFVWCLELIGPILVFSPFFHLPLRLLVLFLLVCMHIGFFLCLEIGFFWIASLTSLMTLTPSWIWDQLEQNIVRSPERLGLKIYYDQDCEFCRKTCLLLRTFLLLPSDTPIQPAQQDPRVGPILVSNNSWVVTDHDGRDYLRWSAIVLLFKRSPLFWPFSYILQLWPLNKIGDRVYYLVGKNRGSLGGLTAVWLPYRPVRLHLPLVFTLIAAFFVCYMIFRNLNTLPGSPLYRAQDPIAPVHKALFFHQRWDMFSPYPVKQDGWLVIPGKLADGSRVDVYNGLHKPPSWKKPNYIAHEAFDSYRWRKYLMRIVTKRYEKHRKFYGRYLCRKWNAANPAREKKLASFEIYYNKLTTLPDYAPRKLRKIRVWRHWCHKKYMPKELIKKPATPK